MLEVGLRLPAFWRWRKILAGTALIITAFASGGLIAWQFNLWGILIFVASFYRIFNCLRVIQGRMNEVYMKRATFRTSVVLIALQVLAAALWLIWSEWSGAAWLIWLVVAAAQLGLALVFFASVVRRMKRTSWPENLQPASSQELPTLTVAIPARNETEQLEQCLKSLIASDYPKLEILVLDDCSQTRRTPEIIRSFAHAGVRFVKGSEPGSSWQPKNHAYARLLEEAVGEYVLFCGVDVRFKPDSLRQFVTTTLAKKKTMVSLLPWRSPSAAGKFAPMQAVRYLWELAPPRRLFNRPSVLSTCWIAKRSELNKAGGFKAVARSIVPEAHFAKLFSRTNDGYSFMRASQTLGIESAKPLSAQRDTAIRVRYPQLRRRPENVFFLGQLYGFFVFLPFSIAVAGFWISVGIWAQIMAAAAVVLLILVYAKVTAATRTGNPWLSLIALPVSLLSDLVILHVSMWKYEFSVVEWKGRNICIPVMHVASRLPKN